MSKEQKFADYCADTAMNSVKYDWSVKGWLFFFALPLSMLGLVLWTFGAIFKELILMVLMILVLPLLLVMFILMRVIYGLHILITGENADGTKRFVPKKKK